MVALALVTGLRRGEILALRWKDFDPDVRTLTVRPAIYEERIDTPKTAKSVCSIPVLESTCSLLSEWASTAISNLLGSTQAIAQRFKASVSSKVDEVLPLVIAAGTRGAVLDVEAFPRMLRGLAEIEALGRALRN